MVSAVTIWEIWIKHALARGRRNGRPISGHSAPRYFRDAGFALLDITAAQIAFVETLAPRHADPFDRLLVAQSLAVPLRLVTHDALVAGYSDSIILV